LFNGSVLGYAQPIEILLYYITFFVMPFVLISGIRIEKSAYDMIFYSIVLGGIIFSYLTYIYYGNYLGVVTRISQEVTKGDNYISPLSLSYSAVLVIGISLSFIVDNRVLIMRKIIILIAIMACMIPFFLGASRGSVLSLIIPNAFYMLVAKGGKSRSVMIYLTVFLVVLLYISTAYFGTGVFDRLLGMREDVEYGSRSAIRLDIWSDSWSQFIKDPIYGNSLENNSTGMYPHNIILEVLISTGVLGFIPFVMFLSGIIKKAIYITANKAEYYWVVVMFLQSLISSMFSGSIYSSSWLVLSSALILSVDSGYEK
jgi:O-antigen ligase